MKTFKTRSSAMRRVNESTTDNTYNSSIVSINSSPSSSSSSSSSSSYILFLDKITYNCIEDGTICMGTGSAAYFYYLSQNIDINFNKIAFTSDNFYNYKDVIAIFILDKLYTVEYKGISDLYITYTINGLKNTVLDNLDRISKTNKQVAQDYRGFYQIFTDKGKVRAALFMTEASQS